MKMLSVMIALACVLAVHGQTTVTRACKSCMLDRFNGNPTSDNNCYDNITNVGSVSLVSVTPYCVVEFTFNDEIVTGVIRQGREASTDTDHTTTAIPATPSCINAGGTTTCTYTCNTDDCNTMTLSSLMSCAAACENGYCNYFTGTCTCNAGFSGSTCATAATVTYRSCVQCNEDVDTGCVTKTAGTQCAINRAATEVYCITRKTTLLDASGNVVRSRITRGCTRSRGVQDQCTFSDTADPNYTGFTEETCTSTCDTNNCNTGTPDGALTASETSLLYCVQCSSTNPSSTCFQSTARTRCPSTANQCYSKVVYYYNGKSDLRHNDDPAVRLASVERSCRSSTTSVNTCTNATLTGTNSLKVTCEESCATDGCNDHWPARPRCSQCSTLGGSSDLDDGYDTCSLNPPVPASCSSPAHQYCVRVQQARENSFLSSLLSAGGSDGITHGVRRACAFHDHGNACNTTYTVGDVNVMQCNKTCTVDGCNQGNGSTAVASQSTMMILLPALLAYFLQQFSQ